MPVVNAWRWVYLTLTTLAVTNAQLTGTPKPYVQPNSTGLKIRNGFERVLIQPFGPHGFRVRASLYRDPTGSELSAFLDPPLEGPGGNQGIAHEHSMTAQGTYTLRNGDLVVSATNGALSFYRIEPDDSLTLLTSEYKDTKALNARYYVQSYRSSSFSAQFSFSSTEDEQFYGTGQQHCCNDNTVNKKGQVVDMMNFNSQVPTPVFMSNKGYLQYFNMVVSSSVHRKPALLLKKQPSLTITCRQPTPPDFILGYQQSKLRYWNQSQVVDLAQRFHDEKVNVSLIVVDFFAWKYQGDWSFDEEFWPDPADMAATVKKLTGAEMMVSLWPSVEDKSVNYLTLQQEGFLASTRDGPGVQDSVVGVYTRLVDSTNPGAREFLWRRLNESYFSKGIHNFWIDQADGGSLGEPFVNNGQDAINDIPYNRPFTQYWAGTQEGAGKAYPWLHQQAIDEGLRNLTGTTDTHTRACTYMSLTRNTFAGGQRFCSYLWSGDTESRFDVMLQQVTAGVSVAASGISSWTLDIGGFFGLDVDTAFGRQLFVRWLSMGVFLPYMRVHGMRSCSQSMGSTPFFSNPCPNEPWSYGEENFAIIKQDSTLLSGTSSYHTSNGCSRCSKAPAAGPRILVSPVGVENALSKAVYLPKLSDAHIAQGYVWRYWWGDETYGEGGRTVVVDAPLDKIPVFYLGEKGVIFSGHV